MTKEEKSRRSKHFVIMYTACIYWGIGIAVQRMGIEAHLGLCATLTIFISSQIFFIYSAFTSLQEVKDILFNNGKYSDDPSKRQPISFLDWVFEETDYETTDYPIWTNANNPTDTKTTEQLYQLFLNQSI